MSRLNDVCWHEAGHAIVAGLHGLSARRTVVRRTESDDDWVGFNMLTGHPGSMLIVAAAGVTSELMRLNSALSQVDEAAIQKVLQGARDDQDKHRKYSELAQSRETFMETIKLRCWPALVANRNKVAALADELARYLSVGPLVHSAIMSGLPIEDDWRKADELYLLKLPPPPPTPA